MRRAVFAWFLSISHGCGYFGTDRSGLDLPVLRGMESVLLSEISTLSSLKGKSAFSVSGLLLKTKVL